MKRNKVLVFFDLIKFEHTVFALPFAYMGMLLARGEWPSSKVFWLVTLAMVAARTTGMILNRIIDLGIDAKNPRTQNRPIITGEFSTVAAWVATFCSGALFFLFAWLLNDLCFKLSFFALFLLTGYSLVKRFSFLCHFAIGLVLAAAPMGGWIAVTGQFSWMSVLLALAVLFWVAGFDIIYSLQDLEFDRTHGLHSLPVRFGEKKSLALARLCHLLTVFFLIGFSLTMQLGAVYWAGIVLVAGVLTLEHRLIWDGDLSRMDVVFFTLNGWVGILLLIFSMLEIYR